MSLETFDWYITEAVEQKLQDKGIYGATSEAVHEIVSEIKRNMVKSAMVFISGEYMEEIVNKHKDWDNF